MSEHGKDPRWFSLCLIRQGAAMATCEVDMPEVLLRARVGWRGIAMELVVKIDCRPYSTAVCDFFMYNRTQSTSINWTLIPWWTTRFIALDGAPPFWDRWANTHTHLSKFVKCHASQFLTWAAFWWTAHTPTELFILVFCFFLYII